MRRSYRSKKWTRTLLPCSTYPHVVYKSSSSTTKIRAVFDASANSNSGVSLNDTLLVGPTVHPPLLNVLLRFRAHRVALTADVSKMYRAIQLVQPDRDLAVRSKPRIERLQDDEGNLWCLGLLFRR